MRRHLHHWPLLVAPAIIITWFLFLAYIVWPALDEVPPGSAGDTPVVAPSVPPDDALMGDRGESEWPPFPSPKELRHWGALGALSVSSYAVERQDDGRIVVTNPPEAPITARFVVPAHHTLSTPTEWRSSWPTGHPVSNYGCHTCDTPACVNPDHIFDGTAADNTGDAIRKGRLASKLSVDDVRSIRADGRKQGVIAAEYGVSQAHISHIRSGRSWSRVS